MRTRSLIKALVFAASREAVVLERRCLVIVYALHDPIWHTRMLLAHVAKGLARNLPARAGIVNGEETFDANSKQTKQIGYGCCLFRLLRMPGAGISPNAIFWKNWPDLRTT
jgi:hypothetical protein